MTSSEELLYEADQDSLLITFQVGEAHYGLETGCVQEVILVGAITRVYHAPDYVRGIINLRGKIVTVIDLKQKLYEIPTEITDASRVLIVESMKEYVGVLVDSIGDVLALQEKQIETRPANMRESMTRFVRGIFRSQGQVAAVLNLEALLA